MTPLGATYSGVGSEPQVIEVPDPQKGYWTIVADGNSTGTIDIYAISFSSGGAQIVVQPIMAFDVNETTSLEFGVSVIRMVDNIGLVQTIVEIEHTYTIDISMTLVEEPAPSQLARLEVTATSTDTSIGSIEGTEALEHEWYLYDITDTLTPVTSGILTWNGIDSRWEVTIDRGYFTSGEYYFLVEMRSIHSGTTMKNQTPSFIIDHQLTYSLPTVVYDQNTQTIVSGSFEVNSSYIPHGTVDDIEATTYDWYLYDAQSGGSVVASGTLVYALGEFVIGNTSVADILEGSYYLRVYIVTSEAANWVNSSTVTLVLQHTLILSGAVWDSSDSQVTLSGLIATSSYGPVGTVDDIEATNSSYYIFTSTGQFTGLSGALSYSAGEWSVTVDISSLGAGDYYIFAVIADGINEVSTANYDFTVEAPTTPTTTTTPTTSPTTTTTPTTTPSEPDLTMVLFILGGVGGVIVILVILVVLRRKR
jgi:hypothetical protein